MNFIQAGIVFAFLAVATGNAMAVDATRDSPSDLKSFLSSQHVELKQLLNAMATKLDSPLHDGCVGDGNGQAGAKNNASGEVGVNYVRWGRISCSDTAEKIYDGYVGKSHYTHGGGVNYLCLPRDPEFPADAASGHQSNAYIYGTEYQHNGSPVLQASLNDNDVPCVVCEASGRSQVLMVPAKATCPAGWNKEYQGLLMSQHYTEHGSDFICVADGMESLTGGATNHNGGLLYVVEAVCGSLPRPPYSNGYELTCVVCTK